MRSKQARYSNSPEALVVSLAKTGDEAAFEEILARRQSWIRNLLRRLSSDSNLADDLAQQTFLQAWKDLSSLRDSKAFPAWLKLIAINIWRQHCRKQELPTSQDDRDVGNGRVTESPSVGLDLDHALALLSSAVRLCIVLSYHEGMSHSEIATVTELPLGTVKSHIRRGTLELQSSLAAYREQNSKDTHNGNP